jgi:SAM-dependent methyltransferase
MDDNKDDYSLFPRRHIDAIVENKDGNYFIPVLSEVLTEINDPHYVCDVGCGNGLYSIVLKEQIDCHLVGVDGSNYALDKAKKIGFDEAHYVGDLSNDSLPFADESYDLVICKDVLEHLLDPSHLVSEISRIIKPGGYCLLHVPNHFPLIGRIRILFNNNIDTFDYFPDSNRWDFPHIRFFDKASLLKLAEIHKLSISLDLSWHFFRPARVSKYIPWLAHILGNRYSDLTSEGISLLLKK